MDIADEGILNWRKTVKNPGLLRMSKLKEVSLGRENKGAECTR
ncbi:hypothetical protein [Thermanaeromonas toyohensis]|nr:hypothetical protein [Thermanaeromonas toyohensis]